MEEGGSDGSANAVRVRVLETSVFVAPAWLSHVRKFSWRSSSCIERGLFQRLAIADCFKHYPSFTPPSFMLQRPPPRHQDNSCQPPITTFGTTKSWMFVFIRSLAGCSSEVLLQQRSRNSICALLPHPSESIKTPHGQPALCQHRGLSTTPAPPPPTLPTDLVHKVTVVVGVVVVAVGVVAEVMVEVGVGVEVVVVAAAAVAVAVAVAVAAAAGVVVVVVVLL